MDIGKRSGEGRDQEKIDEGSAKVTRRPLTEREARAAEAMSAQDRMRVEYRLADRFLDAEARDRLKSITYWRLERERKAPTGEMAELVSSLAYEFEVDPRRVRELCSDPDHGGGVTPNSIDEARVGLVLECAGRLREVVRDPRPGCGDLIEEDGMGQEWDVFGPQGGILFDVDQAAAELGRKLQRQRQDERMIKVIVNTASLSEVEHRQMRGAVEERGWTQVVLLFRSSRFEGTR